ncbi:MAG: sugar transferase [Planctomycetota bacterium]
MPPPDFESSGGPDPVVPSSSSSLPTPPDTGAHVPGAPVLGAPTKVPPVHVEGGAPTASGRGVELTASELVRPSRASRALEVAVASTLSLAALPLLTATYLLVRVVDGRPVLYRGERLGHGARPFAIAKFRTLRTDAQARIGGQLLSPKHGLKTRCGDFLRETRLDELPQLLLVLKGDMALFGPRPERREVYESHCREIPGYEERFRVRPGVFGYSQILTPHSAPKRLRSAIDRRFAARRSSALFDLALIGLTIGSLLGTTGGRLVRATRGLVRTKILRSFSEQRRQARVRPAGVEVRAGSDAFPIADMNDDALLASGPCADRVRAGGCAEVSVALPGARGRRRRAVVRIERVERRPAAGSDPERTLLHYTPSSARSAYVLDQYVLRRSIVRLPEVLRRARPSRDDVPLQAATASAAQAVARPGAGASQGEPERDERIAG